MPNIEPYDTYAGFSDNPFAELNNIYGEDGLKAPMRGTTLPINLSSALGPLHYLKPGTSASLDVARNWGTQKILPLASSPIPKIDVNKAILTPTPDIKAPTNVGALEGIDEVPTPPEASSFMDKFQDSTFSKNFGAWSAGLDMADNLLTGILGEKNEYSGSKGSITKGMDSAYDSIQQLAGNFGPYGLVVSLGMLANKMLGNVANKLGGGTDGMTGVDAVLGSSFFLMTPLGLINGFGGKRAGTITKDEEAFAQVGSSYGGTSATVDEALEKSGKKYGLFSSGARNKANDEIAEAKRQLAVMTDIGDMASDRFAVRDSMSDINGNKRRFQMQGGYNLAAVRVGRKGMIIVKRVASQYKIQERRRKVSDPFLYYLSTLPENQRNSTDFRVRDYWEFNGRPKDFNEAISKGMFIQQEDGWHANSVAENPVTGEIEFMKSTSHPSHHMEVNWYNSDDALEFRKWYELVKTEPYWKYVKRKLVEEFKEGGVIDNISVLLEVDIDLLPEEFKDGGVLGSSIIKEVEIEEMVEEFKEGGAFNVIPEGALHARLHHMENAKNLTKKGIPVVSEKEGGELEQHAEIEKEEIILRLSLTKRLEELAKEDTDEAALEAGKILVEEILNNTVDNTNTLL